MTRDNDGNARREDATHVRDWAGVIHQALRPNDENAWWTQIACGHGICLPGPQTSEQSSRSDAYRGLKL